MDRFLFDYLLRMGDTALVLSQRLSQWCGHGPALEEDLAMTNVSLDLLGQARLWLTLAGEIEGRGRSEEHTSELQSLMRISYAVFCLKKKKKKKILNKDT